ncbi:MAG: iron-containing alcohol dehydrogenase [Oscillospiraceae bacterium]|nr:iron-containing alcohol dehydrogenase [Oscillospiraceae bacterium]
MAIFQYRQVAPVTFGCGAIKLLGEQVRELGCKKVIIVCDNGIVQAGITDKAAESLRAAGIDYVVYDKVVADPPMEIVNEAGNLARAEKVDGVVGLGGGSSMDTAKGVGIMLEHPGDIYPFIQEQPLYKNTKNQKIILVPTTAGTGAECTHVAVISNVQVNMKWSVFCDPTIAIIDPELAVTLPKDETVSTGLDAFAHASEALTSSIAHEHSNVLAVAALQKIGKWLEVSWNEPDNLQAREEMMLAANMAGVAFDNTMCHTGHSIGDALSCRYHTSHGVSCTLALPATMELVGPAVPDKIKLVAQALNLTLKGDESGEQVGKMVAQEICSMMRRMKLKSLKERGCKREDVIALAPRVIANHLTDFCPVKVTLEVAQHMMERVYDMYQ